MQRFWCICLFWGLIGLNCQKERWVPSPGATTEEVSPVRSFGNGPSPEVACMLPIEEMPYALVCHQLETRSERRQCSDLVLQNIIRENMRHPADTATYEGIVYVSLIIRKDGSRGEARIRRGGPASVNQEALRLVELFPPFHPGSFIRQPVDAERIIPIRFHRQ